MPRHPPIALKTLDCSHCQYPSSRIRIRKKIRDLPEPARNGDWTLKDQLLEICSMARLGKPIMWLELSIHSRRISKWINPNKSSLYDVKQNRHRTNHIGSTQTLANDCILVSTPNGGAGRDRTDDPLLAKQVLSQLSYGPLLVFLKRRRQLSLPWLTRHQARRPLGACGCFRIRPKPDDCQTRWWAWIDSNYRPHPYQGCALTT